MNTEEKSGLLRKIPVRVKIGCLFAVLASVILFVIVPLFDNAQVTEVTQVVTEESIRELTRYHSLEKADLSGSDCYEAIFAYAEAHPDVDVTYTVPLGDAVISSKASSATVSGGVFSANSVTDALEKLPSLRSIDFVLTDLSCEDIDAIRLAYPQIELTYSVSVLGEGIKNDAKTLDLTSMEVADADEVLQKLVYFPNLNKVILSAASGKSNLDLNEARDFIVKLPEQIEAEYSFELYGQIFSTESERIEFENVEIGNDGIDVFYTALDIMPRCTYVKLADCGIDSETMAKFRDTYPDVSIVWRVYFGGKCHCLTDAETIRAIWVLKDSNSSELKYCTKVKYMDIGHNGRGVFTDISFMAYMPDLEIVILSGSYISDTSPLANCTKLRWLELLYCGLVTDISALKNATQLECLNISYTHVADLTPILDCPLKRFVYYGSGLNNPQRKEIADALGEDCWTTFDGLNPYMKGWRYSTSEGRRADACDQYLEVRKVFDYDNDPYGVTQS